MTNDTYIFKQVRDYVKAKLENESTGHDYYHAIRVFNTATHIQRIEGGNALVIGISALTHDLIDDKIADPITAQTELEEFLSSILSNQDRKSIIHVIKNISYRNNATNDLGQIETQIVQDADRLDAIGAIGIARTFAYGGRKNRIIFNSDSLNNSNDENDETDHSQESSHNNQNDTISHFYEKLLKLKELMNTKTGHEITTSRHEFMLNYLDQFYKECSGSDL